MKITKSQLQRIIQEELGQILQEEHPGIFEDPYAEFRGSGMSEYEAQDYGAADPPVYRAGRQYRAPAMMDPKEREEVARLRGNRGGQAQIDTARAMLDPSRGAGRRYPSSDRRYPETERRHDILLLAPGAFTDDELQQMQVQESLINDFTEAVLAKLMK